MDGNLVGKLVVCMTHPNNAPNFTGQAEGYYSQPTYLVNGKAWAERLVREATLEEQVAYWKAKAQGTCTQHSPGYPCPTPESCLENGCSAGERKARLPQPPVSWDPDK